VLINGRTGLFIYAPGICNGQNLNPDRVRNLTGVAFNTPGISRVDREDWISVYVPTYKTLTPKVLREVALEAGVTIYCQDFVPVYANQRLFAIHMAEGGEKTITLPVAARQVKELYTQRVISVVDKRFRYRFATPDTALFEIG
jgi:hypothetical protein